MTTSSPLTYVHEKIIDVANELLQEGCTAASTGERIAAALAMERPEFLPELYREDTAAWERLGERWGAAVREIRAHHRHLINAEAPPRFGRPRGLDGA